MNPGKRYTRPRVEAVPKQSRPNMVLKAFRVPEPLWVEVEAWAEDHDVNPSDAVREALTRLVSDDDGRGD